MKTLFLSIPYGMSARNFLRSDVFRVLREHFRLVVITPLARDRAFLKEFEHPNATFVAVSRRDSFFLLVVMQLLFMIQTYFFTKAHPIETLEMLRNQLRRENPIRYFLYVAFANTVGRVRPAVHTLESLYKRLQRNPALEQLFKNHQPVLTFLTHPFVRDEIEIALASRAHGVPVIGMIHSWDNLTAKSGMRQLITKKVGRVFPADLFDRVVVWNDILANELVELYSYPRERIFLSGIPQFDAYVTAGKSMTREAFFSSFGGDPKKRLIYFLATSPALIHDQTLAVRTLIDAMKSGKFGPDCQLLIRFHPRTDMSDWVDLFKGPNVFFQTPSSAYNANAVGNGWQAEAAGVNDLGESLYHSAVVINGMSTTAIDGAWFDKPIICFAFDGDAANNRMMPVFYSNTHYKKLLEQGGVRVAWTPDQMVDYVCAYLADPALETEGRRRIRERYIYRMDGKAGERVARFILEVAGATDDRP